MPSVGKYLGCTIVPTAAQMYFCWSKHPVFLSSAHRLKHTFNKWGFLDWIACVSSGRLVWDYSPPILRLRSFILLLACSVSTQQFLRFWKIKTNWKNKSNLNTPIWTQDSFEYVSRCVWGNKRPSCFLLIGLLMFLFFVLKEFEF